MSTSAIRPEPRAVEVTCTDDALHVRLVDRPRDQRPAGVAPSAAECVAGRTPKLASDWRGRGLRWPDVDEDISAAALLTTR
jgi:hypothetical protein